MLSPILIPSGWTITCEAAWPLSPDEDETVIEEKDPAEDALWLPIDVLEEEVKGIESDNSELVSLEISDK